MSRIEPGTPITLADVEGETFVSLREGHSIRVVQDKLFRRSGFDPKILLETNTLEVGKQVAIASGACMLMPNIYMDDSIRRKRGEFYPLKDYDNHRHLYACYRKDEFLPKYTRDFIHITTRVLTRQDFPDPPFVEKKASLPLTETDLIVSKAKRSSQQPRSYQPPSISPKAIPVLKRVTVYRSPEDKPEVSIDPNLPK